jgi:uncharacterized NAD(P)/FAD-binding protein YdhS
MRRDHFGQAPIGARATTERTGYDAGTRIAVVGGGFSGVMTAIHLLWRCRRGDRIYLFERSERLGPGLAYSTLNHRHLVNTRVENMSAFEDEPDHFARWLKRHPAEERGELGERTIAGQFVKRATYGAYIQELMRDAITRQGGAENLFLVADSADAAEQVDGHWIVTSGLGRRYEVDAVVLAVGNLAPDDRDTPHHVSNPWRPGALQGLDPEKGVLLLGTGLTMVDVALQLIDQGFSAPILAMSRRGQLPQSHAPARAWSDLHFDADDRSSLLRLFQAVRREIDRAAADGVNWRSVIDAMRANCHLLWRDLSEADRARFLRHVRPWWDIHRHRMAPPVAATFEALRASGRLQLLAGRLAGIEPTGRTVKVAWRPRGAAVAQTLNVQRVIDCTGLRADLSKSTEPLIRNLLADGLARPNHLGLGIDVEPPGSVVDAGGEVTPGLFAVGPITRGAYWEITAVTDIRAQVEQVAATALYLARQREAS